MDEMINETTEMDDVTTNEELDSTYESEGSFAGTAIVIGGTFLLGMAFHKFVAPAIGKAIDTVRVKLVEVLTKDVERYEVESEDSKVVEMTDSTEK